MDPQPQLPNEKSPTDSGKKLPPPQIQRECTGPQLAGFGSKKEKDKTQPPQQSQTLSQQLEINLGEQAKQNDSINDSLDTSDQEMNQFFQALSSIKPVKIIKTKEESSEVDEQEQELVLESEIHSKVLQLATHGYELLLSKENLTEAIVELRRAENVISTYLFSEGSVQQSLVLFTLSNLAIAYYRIGFLEESLVCLENCLVSLKNQTEFTTLPSNQTLKEKSCSFFLSQKAFFTSFPGRLTSKRLRCNFHMQCCIILSEMRRHEDALIHSRLAARLAFKVLIDTLVLALAVFVCLFYEKNVNEDLVGEDEGKDSTNEEYQFNNQNSQAIRRSKRCQEDSQLEDLAITSNKQYDPQSQENLPEEVQKPGLSEEDKLIQQEQQQQQATRIDNFAAFMSV